MALNTPEKRRAAAGVGFFIVGPGVTPNSAKDVEWRREVAWSYPFNLGGLATNLKHEGLTRNVGRFLK